MPFAARPSREEIPDVYFEFPQTRDCQSIAGFLLNGHVRVAQKKDNDVKTNQNRLTATFGPEVRFDVAAVPAAPFRATAQTQLEALKSRLLTEALDEVWEPELNSDVRRAANEAAALAWVTTFPLLLFPVLFEEKVETALRFAARQERVRERTRELLAL